MFAMICNHASLLTMTQRGMLRLPWLLRSSPKAAAISPTGSTTHTATPQLPLPRQPAWVLYPFSPFLF